MEENETSYRGDSRPVPDPTALTTDASNKLEATLRTLIATEIAHNRELFIARLAALLVQFSELEKRTAEQKQDVKSALDAALAAAKEAVALQTVASEKSIAKSETATAERIKALETLLATSTNALGDKIVDLQSATNDKLGDIKDRVVALEAIRLGVSEGVATVHQSSSDSRAVVASFVSAGLAVLALLGFVITIVAK